jgi:hypothetical protein
MTKRFKKILFFGLCLFFVVTAPSVIFYSQGYRFDFNNKKIVQTGGIFLRVSPPGATIYLDKKLYKKIRFFFETAFINGLIPKNYEIAIEKTDYHPWNKILKVEESQVTEAKDIILFPKNPEFNLIAKKVDNFFPSPDGIQTILQVNEKNSWSLKLFNTQTQEQSELINEQELLSIQENKKINKIIFLNLIWSDDSTKILLNVSINGEQRYLRIDTKQQNKFFIVNLENNLRDVYFNPINSEEIFYLGPISEESENKTIFRLKNTGEQSMLNFPSSFSSQNIITHTAIDDSILWLNESGFVYRGRINGNKINLLQSLNLKPIIINKDANYSIIAEDSSKIFIKENEGLYYLNIEKYLFEKIFDSIKTMEFSEDKKKIVVNTKNQIEVFFLEKENGQPKREIGEKIFLAGFSNEINNLFWLNNHYVIFCLNEAIKIAEIDNRSKPNLIELTSFPEAKIFWDKKQKNLFVLSDENLFSCSDIIK